MNQTTSPGDSLSNRTISAFPLSIGTSLSFESLFSPQLSPYDPNRPIPNNVNVSDYKEIWINLETLFRNINGAISKEAFLQSTEKEFKEVLEFEIEVINNLFNNEGMGICKPYYYYSTYDEIIKHPPHDSVRTRQDKTDFQKFYTFKLVKALELLFKGRDDLFKLSDIINPKAKVDALIISHIPYDLLSYVNFHRLDLLESHTGKLKPRHLWNTKYFPVGDSDLSMLPFCKKLLLIFGDKVLIQPSDIKLRKTIVDIAVKRKWTPMTTEAKMMLDFELEIKEPLVFQFLRSLK